MNFQNICAVAESQACLKLRGEFESLEFDFLKDEDGFDLYVSSLTNAFGSPGTSLVSHWKRILI